MRSIFPYVGGKHRLAPRLIKLFDAHTCYVEVFAGALNVLFAKDRVKCEVVNDVNRDLINIFRIIRYHPDELFKELICITHSRQEFNDYHDQPGLTDVQRAARYFFRLKTSYGGTAPAGHQNFGYKTLGFAGFRHNALDTIAQAHERLDGVHIENQDFEDLIKRYDRKHSLFFCDPPYWQLAGYAAKFDWSDHERLAASLKKIKGKFLLTINDHPDIRKLYKGLPQIRHQVSYSVVRKIENRKTPNPELVIANYPLPRTLR